MSSLARIAVATSWIGLASAFAAPSPVPPVPPTPAAPAAPEGKQITLHFQGSLREALKAIADKGGINLVITGELKDPAEVHLTEASAEEALKIVAEAHALRVHRQGSIWTIRPLNAQERAAKELAEHGASDAPRAAAPVPPAPPVPPTPPDMPDMPDRPDVPVPPDAPDMPDSFADDNVPDPVTDPSGFERHIKERVQRDVRAKLMKKFRDKNFGRGGNDVFGTGHVVVAENETVGDAVSYGGGLEVKGHVEGSAVAFGGGVHLGPNAEVDGDVVSFGGGITKEDGADVGGEEISLGGDGLGRAVASSIPMVVRSSKDRDHRGSARPPSSGSLPSFLVWFAVLFGGGFLAMMFAPNRMRLLEAELRRDPLRCGVTGVLGALSLPVLTLLLTITLIGILVVPVLWVVVAVGCLMGIAALANQIGTRLPLRNVRKTQAVVLALGVLMMELVGLIPVLGGLAWIAIFALSLGAVIRSRFGTRQLGPIPG